MVFFFRLIDGKDKDTDEEKKIPLLRYYSVFHISQCEGMKPRFAEPFHSDLKPDKQEWLSALKGDKRFIVGAAGKAEKADNLILDNITSMIWVAYR